SSHSRVSPRCWGCVAQSRHQMCALSGMLSAVGRGTGGGIAFLGRSRSTFALPPQHDRSRVACRPLAERRPTASATPDVAEHEKIWRNRAPKPALTTSGRRPSCYDGGRDEPARPRCPGLLRRAAQLEAPCPPTCSWRRRYSSLSSVSVAGFHLAMNS